MKISVSNVKNAFDGIVPVQGETVSGLRRIDFTLEGVEHLPKMDGVFGKCDAYAVLSFDGAEYRTEVVKNAYDARWDAAFHLDVDEAEKGTNSGATVTVFDWDAASKDDEIGGFAISAARMSELFRGNLDSEARQVFSVRLDGKSVIGHDKRKCEVLHPYLSIHLLTINGCTISIHGSNCNDRCMLPRSRNVALSN